MRKIQIDVKGGYLSIVDRNAWDSGHTPRTTRTPPLSVLRIVSTNTDPCFNQRQCETVLRDLMERNLNGGSKDIQYNFLVSNDGTIYEGTGWLGSCSDSPCPRGRCVDIGYIGTFNSEKYVPYTMTSGVLSLIKVGLRTQMLTPSYHVTHFRPDPEQPKATDSSFVYQERKVTTEIKEFPREKYENVPISSSKREHLWKIITDKMNN